jgi:tetraacyldisaccharide 4'-kinase
MLQRLFNFIWYNHKAYFIGCLLYPLSIIYRIGFNVIKIIKSKNKIKHKIPVIVIGNITVGGTGKTPMVIAVARFFQNKGIKVAIISRGYRAKCKTFPAIVNDNADLYGDEPVLISNSLQCPVIIDPKRNRAIEYIKNSYDVNLIISDDGLQHFPLTPSIKILLIDGNRLFGNGMCLPAGPLREPFKKYHHDDFIVINSPAKIPEPNKNNVYNATIKVTGFACLHNDKMQPVEFFRNKKIAAITGIANPTRFFKLLRDLNIDINEYAFKDHHNFNEKNLAVPEEIIIMTEKDAVKCKNFSRKSCYYLKISLEPSANFFKDLCQHSELKGLIVI